MEVIKALPVKSKMEIQMEALLRHRDVTMTGMISFISVRFLRSTHFPTYRNQNRALFYFNWDSYTVVETFFLKKKEPEENFSIHTLIT